MNCFVIFIVGSLMGVLLLSSGCSKGGDEEIVKKSVCEVLLDKLIECFDEKFSKSEVFEFVEKCDKNTDTVKFKGKFICVGEGGDCDAFKKCVKGAREKAYLVEQLEELKVKSDADSVKYMCGRFFKKEAIKDNEDVKKVCGAVMMKVVEEKIVKIKKEVKDGKGSIVMSSCKYVLKDDYIGEQETLKTYCKDLLKMLLAVMIKLVMVLCDAGKHDFQSCYELKSVAKAVGDDAVIVVEVFCQETKVVKDVIVVLKKVDEEIKTDKSSILYNCESIIKLLQKIDLEWSKKQMPKVAEACYAKLGKDILKKIVSEIYCSGHKDKKIIVVFDKYKFMDADLKTVVDAVRNGRCKGKILQ